MTQCPIAGDQMVRQPPLRSGVGQLFQRNGLVEGEGAARAPAQLDQMGAAAEPVAHVVRQGPDVDPTGTADGKSHLRRLDPLDLQGIDFDLPRLPMDLLPLPGEFVEGYTVPFQGRIHGGNLAPPAEETLDRRSNDVRSEPLPVPFPNHPAGTVLGIGRRTETHYRPVLLDRLV